MKKLCIIALAVLFSIYLYGRGPQGAGYSDNPVTCTYSCPDGGGMTIMSNNCEPSWFDSCWRTLCPDVSNVCF